MTMYTIQATQNPVHDFVHDFKAFVWHLVVFYNITKIANSFVFNGGWYCVALCGMMGFRASTSTPSDDSPPTYPSMAKSPIGKNKKAHWCRWKRVRKESPYECRKTLHRASNRRYGRLPTPCVANLNSARLRVGGGDTEAIGEYWD